jgi:hypothetical protein
VAEARGKLVNPEEEERLSLEAVTRRLAGRQQTDDTTVKQ